MHISRCIHLHSHLSEKSVFLMNQTFPCLFNSLRNLCQIHLFTNTVYVSVQDQITTQIWNLSTIALQGSMINFTWIYLWSPSPEGTLTSSLLFKWSSLRWGTLLREPFSTEEMLLKLRPNLQKSQTKKYIKLAHITIFIWLLLYATVLEQTRLIFRIMHEVHGELV